MAYAYPPFKNMHIKLPSGARDLTFNVTLYQLYVYMWEVNLFGQPSCPDLSLPLLLAIEHPYFPI